MTAVDPFSHLPRQPQGNAPGWTGSAAAGKPKPLPRIGFGQGGPFWAKLLTELDSSHDSLTPLFVKDMIDSTGRTVMEYRRGGKGANHAGRERGIEDYVTSVIWVYGKPFFEASILNPLFLSKMLKLNPQIEPNLICKLQQHGIKVPQFIDTQLKKNAPRLSTAEIAKISEWYKWATRARFVTAAGLAAFLIGWVLPPINQAITRRLVSKERAAASASDPNVVAVTHAPPRKMQRPLAAAAGSFYPIAAVPPHVLPAYYSQPPAFDPQQAGQNPFRTTRPNGMPPVAFGASSFERILDQINNPYLGNLAVDAGITGGRLYRARNVWDLMETAVRESSLIFFLYFLGDYVKEQMQHGFDRKFKVATQISFDTMSWFQKHGTHLTAAHWSADRRLIQGLTTKDAFKTLMAKLDPVTGHFKNNPILELARSQKLIHVLDVHELQGRNVSNLKRLWNSTLSNVGNTGVLDWVKQYHPDFHLQSANRYVVDPRHFLDIDAVEGTMFASTREPHWYEKAMGWLRPIPAEIKTPGMAQRLMDLTGGGEAKALGKLFQKTWKYKGLALFSTYAVSCGMIGLAVPVMQHWLTFKLSGKVDFPGTRNQLDEDQVV